MTIVCPSSECPMCAGTECRLCGEVRVGSCHHDSVERHSGMDALPAGDRVPTKEIDPVLAGRCEIDLADGEDAARFLELAAKVIRAKRRIVIVVE